MAIQFVGANTDTVNNNGFLDIDLTSLTGGIGSSALEGDIVVFAGTRAFFNEAFTVTGYTQLSDGSQSSSHEIRMGVLYKIMGSTPDTSVVNISPESNQAGIALVFRGVDVDTPIDATTTTDEGGRVSSSTQPAITTVTDGAFVLAFLGFGNNSSSTISSPPTGYSGLTSEKSTVGSRHAIGAGCYKEVSTAGTESPSQYQSFSGYNNDSNWLASTVALRPGPVSPVNTSNFLAFMQ